MRSTGVLSGGMVVAVAVSGVCGSARAGVNGELKILAGATPALVAGFGAAEGKPADSLGAIGVRVGRERRSEDVPSPGTAALLVLGGVMMVRRGR